ncbi:hypothetical protein V8C37DRAFT_397647 [Trichoderma ceciliae]
MMRNIIGCGKLVFINDELMLSSDLTLYIGGKYKSIAYYHSHSLRLHLQTGKFPSNQRQLPELAAQSSVNDLILCYESIKSCPECLTDYCISITQEGGCWVIKINSYSQLGAARSPLDWKWYE